MSFQSGSYRISPNDEGKNIDLRHRVCGAIDRIQKLPNVQDLPLVANEAPKKKLIIKKHIALEKVIDSDHLESPEKNEITALKKQLADSEVLVQKLLFEDKYNSLVEKYNRLLVKYESVSVQNNRSARERSTRESQLFAQHSDLVDSYNVLVRKYNSVNRETVSYYRKCYNCPNWGSSTDRSCGMCGILY